MGKGHSSRSDDLVSRLGEKMGTKIGSSMGNAMGTAMGKATIACMDKFYDFEDSYEETDSKSPKQIVIAIFIVLCIIALGVGVIWFVTSFLPFHKGIEDPVYTVASSRSYRDQDCYVALSEFETAGFYNIEMVGQGDLVTGWINHENEIVSVTIDDDTFIEGEQFSREAHVVITYHSFENENVQHRFNEELGLFFESSMFQGISFAVPEQWCENTSVDMVSYRETEDGILQNNAIFILMRDVGLHTSIMNRGFANSLINELNLSCITSNGKSTINGYPAICFEGRVVGSDEAWMRVCVVDYGNGQAILGIVYTGNDGERLASVFDSFIESIRY